jgi:hypothetical protein
VGAQHRAVGHLGQQDEHLLERLALGEALVDDDVEVGLGSERFERLPAPEVRAGEQ